MGSTNRNSLVFVDDISAICGGIIGVGGKFCLKGKDECKNGQT